MSGYQQAHPTITLLQYVDDLLVAADSQEECLQGTRDLLQTLGDLGSRASVKKAQICKLEVQYLDYRLKEGQRWLTEAREETILKYSASRTANKYENFWGHQASAGCGFQVLQK